MSRELLQQALDALELGYSSAKAEADQFHAAMAGYKPKRHAQMDADVQQIAAAITALRAALAAPQGEPVAWLEAQPGADIAGALRGVVSTRWHAGPARPVKTGRENELWPLYTTPPAAPRGEGEK